MPGRARLPADPHHDRARRAVRARLVRRVDVPRSEAPDVGQGSAVRVRHRARVRAGGAVPGEVLPGRDGVHRPRCRDHLPVSVHHDLPRARRVRVDRDGRVPARAAGAVRLPAVDRRARVGPGQAGRGPRRRHRAARGRRARARRSRPRGRRSRDDVRPTTPGRPRSGPRIGQSQLPHRTASRTSSTGRARARCGPRPSVSRAARSR